MEKSNSRNILSNLIWRFAERCGAQGVSFIVSVILARLLEPESYGVIAIVTIFITIMNVFVDSGLGNALIQKKDADDLDFSSVFYFNIFICLILYLLMYILAPVISIFFAMDLTKIIRVLSLTILVSGLKNVQQAYISRTLQFRLFFYATLIGTISSAIVGIVLAHMGAQVWALVAQQIINVSVNTLVLWIVVKWRPKRVFSFIRLKELINYGWKLLVSSLIDTFYGNIRQLLIGKLYSSADLAYFDRAKQLPTIFVANINSSIDSVLLPTLANNQDNVSVVKSLTRRAVKTCSYIISPLMIGIAVCADEIVFILLTDKWISCVPMLRVFCLAYLFYPIHTANLNAIKAMGRSDIFLKLEIVKKIIDLILLLVSMNYGVLAMAISLLISSFTSQFVNTWPNKKLINYGFFEQCMDVFPSLLLSLVMTLFVTLVKTIKLPCLFSLVCQVGIGIFVYVFGSIIFRIEAFQYIIKLLPQNKLSRLLLREGKNE